MDGLIAGGAEHAIGATSAVGILAGASLDRAVSPGDILGCIGATVSLLRLVLGKPGLVLGIGGGAIGELRPVRGIMGVAVLSLGVIGSSLGGILRAMLLTVGHDGPGVGGVRLYLGIVHLAVRIFGGLRGIVLDLICRFCALVGIFSALVEFSGIFLGVLGS